MRVLDLVGNRSQCFTAAIVEKAFPNIRSERSVFQFVSFTFFPSTVHL